MRSGCVSFFLLSPFLTEVIRFFIVLGAFFLEDAKAGHFLSFLYHLYTIMTARRGNWRGNWHITNLLFIQSLIIPHRHRFNHFSLYLWHKKFESNLVQLLVWSGRESLND